MINAIKRNMKVIALPLMLTVCANLSLMSTIDNINTDIARLRVRESNLQSSLSDDVDKLKDKLDDLDNELDELENEL